MTRTLFPVTVFGLMLAACPAVGQVPPATAWGTPSPNAWANPSPNLVAGWSGASVAPGFAAPQPVQLEGLRNPIPTGKFILPAYGGSFVAPTFFPYPGGYYPSSFFNYAGYYTPFAPWGGMAGQPVGGLVGTTLPPPPLEPADRGGGRFAVKLAGELPATLIVTLPTDGDVWLDGAKQPASGSSYTLTSPVLKPTERYKFDVRAEWAVNGKRYRAERTVTVAAGDRQGLTLVLGDPVE